MNWVELVESGRKRTIAVWQIQSNRIGKDKKHTVIMATVLVVGLAVEVILRVAVNPKC